MSTMKKTARQTSTQAECGVWLDTVELKEMSKKKQPPRPISKILNPKLSGRGYSVAVALNFTQTKMEMPKTKQTSISSFFKSESRVLQNMPASTAPIQSLSSNTCASTTPEHVASGAKRRRDTTDEAQNCNTLNNSRGDEEYDELQRNINKNGPQDMKDYEVAFVEINSPIRKRKPSEILLPVTKHHFGQEGTQDSLDDLHGPEDCQESNIDIEIKWKNSLSQEYSTTKNGDLELSLLNSWQNEDDFRNGMNAHGRSSTQKLCAHLKLSQKGNRKENHKLSIEKSPDKQSQLSPLRPLSCHNRKLQNILCPRKRSTNLLSHQPDGGKRLVLAKAGGWDEEDNLAALFTQDSEGLRVIAHRSPKTRNPLRDQTNFNFTSPMPASMQIPFVEDEDADEMLFTQDSQGNVVIKH